MAVDHITVVLNKLNMELNYYPPIKALADSTQVKPAMWLGIVLAFVSLIVGLDFPGAKTVVFVVGLVWPLYRTILALEVKREWRKQ